MDTTFLSSDKGKSWQKQYIPSSALSSLAVYGTNIFEGDDDVMGGGVLLSTDTAKSWSRIGNMPYTFSLFIFTDYIFAGAGQSIYRALLSDFVQLDVHPPPSIISKFNIIANPFTSSADFQFDALKESAVFELFDALGRSFLRQQLPAGQASLHLDMKKYPAGIYLARLGVNTIRFIKF